MADQSDKIIDLEEYKNSDRWGVYSYYWGAAVKDLKNNNWTTVLLKPDGRKLDITEIPVIIHDNGIEFLNRGGKIH